MKLNPLVVIAVIFACSFAGRMIGVADAALSTPKTPVTGPSPATAGASMAQAEESKNEPIQMASNTAHSATAGPAQPAFDPAEKDKLLKAIKSRAAALDKKETDLDDRLRYLEIIEARVDEKLIALKQSNQSLSELVAYADEAAQNDIDLLSKMYEQMKPKKAGEIFNKMDATFAAGFLTQMNSENAALILTNMDTDKAYETSLIIASRNAAVHRQ